MKIAERAYGSLLSTATQDELTDAIRSLSFSGEADRTTPRRASSRVYFVRYGEDGPIKIGTARDVKTRIASLQTGTPTELLYLGDIAGGVADEGALHRRFAHIRLVREWFEPTPELLAFIADALKTPAA